MKEERLQDIRSSWILPNGDILVVPGEKHDEYLPKPYKTVESAENNCIRVACTWGYDADISEIHLPERVTNYQAAILVDINESCKEMYNREIKYLIKWYEYGISWNDIVDNT